MSSTDEEIAKSKVLPKSKKDITKILLDAGYHIINKKLSSITDLRLTLANNEIKDIVNVIKSLENTGILLKETTQIFFR